MIQSRSFLVRLTVVLALVLSPTLALAAPPAAAPAATAPRVAPAVVAPGRTPNTNVKSSGFNLGRLYFKSSTDVTNEGAVKTTRSWGLAPKENGSGRSFDRSTTSEKTQAGESSKMTTTTLAKSDAEGNGTQRAWGKQTIKGENGTFRQSGKQVTTTATGEDGNKAVTEKFKTDTRQTTEAGSFRERVSSEQRTENGIVSTNQTTRMQTKANDPSRERQDNTLKSSTVLNTATGESSGVQRFQFSKTGRDNIGKYREKGVETTAEDVAGAGEQPVVTVATGKEANALFKRGAVLWNAPAEKAGELPSSTEAFSSAANDNAAPKPANAAAASSEQLSAAGLARVATKPGAAARFRDVKTGKFVSAVDADARISK